MSIQEFFVRSVHTTEFWVGIALGVIIWLILNTDDITEWWYSNRKKEMIEIGFIYPGAVDDCYSFSLFPCIMIDHDSTNHTRSFMLMWLFWGVNIIRHFM